MFQFSIWLKTPLHQRNKIAQIFNISKKKSTHVADNMIVDDGYYLQDVELAITGDSLRAYLETDEREPAILWNMLIDKIDPKPEPVVVTPTVQEPIPVVVPEPIKETKPQGRPKKK